LKNGFQVAFYCAGNAPCLPKPPAKHFCADTSNSRRFSRLRMPGGVFDQGCSGCVCLGVRIPINGFGRLFAVNAGVGYLGYTQMSDSRVWPTTAA